MLKQLSAEIVDRRRQLEENIHLAERQQKASHFACGLNAEKDEIKEKVSKAIESAKIGKSQNTRVTARKGIRGKGQTTDSDKPKKVVKKKVNNIIPGLF